MQVVEGAQGLVAGALRSLGLGEGAGRAGKLGLYAREVEVAQLCQASGQGVAGGLRRRALAGVLLQRAGCLLLRRGERGRLAVNLGYRPAGLRLVGELQACGERAHALLGHLGGLRGGLRALLAGLQLLAGGVQRRLGGLTRLLDLHRTLCLALKLSLTVLRLD